MLANIRKYKVLLASKSPRRRELMSQLRIPFNVVSLGGIEEKYPEDLPCEEIPQFLSNLKADAYMTHMDDEEMIITADTLVILGERVFGKPVDKNEAAEMLRTLSGNTHKVITGVTISTLEKRISFTCVTKVKFAEISDEEIDYYIENYQPFDKAGAYGIQEWIGTVAVESIEGSFYNVMGLPVHRLFTELKKF